MIRFADPVIPGLEDKQVVLAKNQPEYTPLAVIISPTQGNPALFRLELSPAARERIAAGEDILFAQLTGGQLFRPVNCVLFDPNNPEHIQQLRDMYELDKK